MTHKQAPEPGSPIAKPKAAPTKRPKMTDAEQGAEFERLSRDLGCDDDEKFQDVLRKLAKPKA